MKNHIKNYIKIMGLAAVPFGTAQAENYAINVTQEHKPDAMHFRLSIRQIGAVPVAVKIVWPHDKEYPNPIFEPDYFIRLYSEELRRKEDVFYVDKKEEQELDAIVRKVYRGRWFGDREINYFEWVRFFCKNEANSFEKLSCSTHYLRDQSVFFGRDLSSRVLCALNEGRNALDLAKDAAKMKLEEALKRGFTRDCISSRRCELPNDCSYVCYKLPLFEFMFFLMKDPQRLLSDSEYVLFIDVPDFIGEDRAIFVWFDVRTVFVRRAKKQVGVYCATSEILDTATRKKFCEGLLPGGFRYHLSDTVRSFIRARSHANEQSMSDLESLPARDCFEVEHGRITGAWLEGKRMDTDVSKYVFKCLSEIMEYVKVFEHPKARKLIEDRKEEKLKSSVYKGAVNMKLLEKLEKKQAKPQNEIKLEEEEKEDKKVENNEIKNEIKKEPKKKKRKKAENKKKRKNRRKSKRKTRKTRKIRSKE